MAKSVYIQNRYLIIKDTISSETEFSKPAGGVVIEPDYNDPNIFRFTFTDLYQEREQRVEFTFYDIADLVEEDGITPYTKATFIEFYTANTGFNAGLGGSNPDLQQVTDKGNSTNNPIDIIDNPFRVLDVLSDPVVRLTLAEPPFESLNGVIVAESAKGLRDLRLTLAGRELFLASEIIEMVFNDAQVGNLLQLTDKKDVFGNSVFRLTTINLNTEGYSESSSDATDQVITGAYSTVVNIISTYNYIADTGYGDTFIYVENSSVANATVEVGLAIGANSPPDTRLFTVPKKKGGVNGFKRVTFREFFNNVTVKTGDDVHVRIRETTATGGLEAKGTIEPTSITLEQPAEIRNATQVLRTLVAPTSIDTNDYFAIEAGGSYPLPDLNVVFNEATPFAIGAINVSGETVVLTTQPGELIYTPGGLVNSYDIYNGESFKLIARSTNIWALESATQDISTTRAKLVGTASTNQRYTVSPQVAISQSITLGYNLAEIYVEAYVSVSSNNRDVLFGLFIDGVQRGIDAVVTNLDNNANIPVSFKLDREIVSSGVAQTYEIRYGRGTQNTTATLENPKILIKPYRD